MRFLAALLLSVLFSFPALAAQVIEGKVVGISDGDTITVLTDEKRQVKIRLYGVDCPESKQAYGTRARQSSSGHVFGKRVRVEVADTDRYGRTVGIVTGPDGTVLNRALIFRPEDRRRFRRLFGQYEFGNFPCRGLQVFQLQELHGAFFQ